MYQRIFIVLLFALSVCSINAQTDTLRIEEIEIDTSDYISGDNNFNLLIASSKGYGEEVISLLEKGADINTQSEDGVTPLMYAASFGHLETVKILILNEANINSKPADGTTAILSSSIAGYLEITEELIIAGAKVNDRDIYGATPLLYGSAYNHISLCDMLLYYGANINMSDYQLTSSLMAAVYAGNIGVAEMLLAEGANINNKDLNGQTALMIAAQNNDTAFVHFLLSNGADLDDRSKKGYTAFYAAAYNGSVPVMDMLWKSNKNSKTIDFSNPNPYYSNQKTTSRNVKKWLKEHEIKPKLKLGISKIYLGGDLAFNSNDFFMGFRMGVVEKNTNISADFDYSFRPAQQQILYKEGDDDYYQFWEKRNKLSITLSKNLPFLQLKSSFIVGGYLALSGTYSFGPHYRATDINAASFFRVSPQIGLYGESKNLYFRLYYEYLNLGLMDTSPHWINLGVYYKFSLMKKTYSNKEIQWF